MTTFLPQESLQFFPQLAFGFKNLTSKHSVGGLFQSGGVDSPPDMTFLGDLRG